VLNGCGSILALEVALVYESVALANKGDLSPIEISKKRYGCK